MDEDIRNALFEESEAFEELDDDFVTQVINQPAEDERDFDFELHIAKLIERRWGWWLVVE